MTKKQLTQFLISLGLKQDKAEKLTNQIPDGLKDLPDDDLKEALEEIVSYNNDLFKNTDDYKNALKSKHDQAMREVLTKTEKKIVKLAGLSPEDIKDKDIDSIIELAMVKSAKKGDSTLEQLQAELIKRDKEIEAKAKEVEDVKESVKSEIEAFKVNNLLNTKLSKFKYKEGTDIEDISVIINNRLNKSNAILKLNDKGDLEILNKDGSKIISDDKRSTISLDNFLDSNLEGYLAKNNVIQEPLKVNVKQGQDNISEHQKWLNEQRAKRMAQ